MPQGSLPAGPRKGPWGPQARWSEESGVWGPDRRRGCHGSAQGAHDTCGDAQESTGRVLGSEPSRAVCSSVCIGKPKAEAAREPAGPGRSRERRKEEQVFSVSAVSSVDPTCPGPHHGHGIFGLLQPRETVRTTSCCCHRPQAGGAPRQPRHPATAATGPSHGSGVCGSAWRSRSQVPGPSSSQDSSTCV